MAQTTHFLGRHITCYYHETLSFKRLPQLKVFKVYIHIGLYYPLMSQKRQLSSTSLTKFCMRFSFSSVTSITHVTLS